MRLTDPRLWIGALSTLAVAWLSIDAMGRTSPGPLTAVHGEVAGLEGRRTCTQCHGGWFQDMAESCLGCHELIRTQLADGTGLHGSLGEERGRACAPCHSEHHGTGFAIVNRASFAQAGVPDPEAFDHSLVGHAMTGRHLEIGCESCHLDAKTPVLGEGMRRFLGLDANCATCHDDPHQGRMQLACADCHAQTAFAEVEPQGHDRYLALSGGHAEVTCRACHATEGTHALESIRSRDAIVPRTCADCHASPHSDTLLDGAAKLAHTSPAQGCVTCHLPEHVAFDDGSATITAEQHAAAGFPLAAPHDAVECTSCHAAAAGDFAARHPQRSADHCAACHQDPHGGQFATGAFAPGSCTTCHDRAHFTPHAFTVDQHDRTTLPLTDRHREVACDACHALAADAGPRRFHATPSTCADCHVDAHDGFFARTGDDPDCARCHSPRGFDAPLEGRFDHERDAHFAIRGAHAQGDCAGCHVVTAEADATHRTFGRIDPRFGATRSCAVCHVDPHADDFVRASAPVRVEGRTGCARCHVESSFRALPPTFDHGIWTGFPLSGAHANAACSRCHAPRLEPDARGRTWERARGARCADCHQDPHAGQFRVAERTDCARCHAANDTFHASSFDHERDARFALAPTHVNVPCAACHRVVDLGGASIVRYRPLGTDCADCHGKNDDPLRRGGKVRR